MRTLLIVLSVVALVSCNREEPPTPSAPVQPTPGQTYAIVNGMFHSNDTLYFATQRTVYIDTSGTYVNLLDTILSQNLVLHTDLTTTGSDTITNLNYQTHLEANGHSYSNQNIGITITRMDNPGGLVEGNFSGYFIGFSPAFDTAWIEGQFSLPRQ